MLIDNDGAEEAKGIPCQASPAPASVGGTCPIIAHPLDNAMMHVATCTCITTVTTNAIDICCKIADLDELVRAQRDPGGQEAR